MFRNLLILSLYIHLSDVKLINAYIAKRPDLTIIGSMKYADGLDRLSIGFIDCLYKDLNINFLSPNPIDFADLPAAVQQVINKQDGYFKHKTGKVTLFLSNPKHLYSNAINLLPKSDIKLAYSMLESNSIPKDWVKIFNNKFDAVVVPDKWLVNVYEKSGVKIPIFILPHGIYLKEFLEYKKRYRTIDSSLPFVFGCSAVFSDSKNQKLLVKAFHKEFGNNSKVRLVLHGRRGDTAPIFNLIKKLNSSNIKIINRVLNKSEYLEYMASLDCYVLVSKGEGFSVTPREALALGIPVILSNNTAHKTICNTGFVRPVKSDIPEDAYYVKFNDICGKKFNCKLLDVSEALSDVYNNYFSYLEKAKSGKEWVKQYQFENLFPKFISLFKPEKILYSTINSIEEYRLLTNSEDFLNKCQNI